MICRLTNISDVCLMLTFTTGREELLHPGEHCLYNDHFEILVSECWEFVDMGWIKDEDHDEVKIEKHEWALEGF